MALNCGFNASVWRVVCLSLSTRVLLFLLCVANEFFCDFAFDVVAPHLPSSVVLSFAECTMAFVCM